MSRIENPISVLIDQEVQERFLAIFNDDNYQHLADTMKSFGKRAIVPAWLLISRLAVSYAAPWIDRYEQFALQCDFSRISSVSIPITLSESVDEHAITFRAIHRTADGGRTMVGSVLAIQFLEREAAAGEVPPLAQRSGARTMTLTDDQFSEFAGFFEATDSSLTRLLFLSACATSLVLLSFKDPQNEFEEAVSTLKAQSGNTPFYRKINVKLDSGVSIDAGEFVFEYLGYFKKGKTTIYDFCVRNGGACLVRGLYELDFISQAAVMRFADEL